MSDEPRPDVRWAPRTPPPKRRARVWWIVGLSIVAVLVVAALLWFSLPRGSADPVPTGSGTPSPSATRTASPTPEPSPTDTAAPAPSESPIATAPPVSDPDLSTFRTRVQPWLDDAQTGLEFFADSSGTEAAQIVQQLREDVERLSDTVAPSSIAEPWTQRLSTYGTALGTLADANASGADTTAPREAAIAALQELRATAGL